MTKKLNIAILGASGYTGAELLRLLPLHPNVRIAALSGDSKAGQEMASVYPHLAALTLPPLQKIEDIDFSFIDVAFGCLPHATTHKVATTLPGSTVLIDLSADFRLRDPAQYRQWYGQDHAATDLQREAVYGLTEHSRDAVKSARVIANPGCYPTAAQLPLIPLLKAGLIETDGIVIDAKSGISGAGRKAQESLLFTEADGGVSAYGVGTHRHIPEIEQGLSEAAGSAVQVRFTPHLIPMARGILATSYVRIANGHALSALREALHTAYDEEPFVTILPEGKNAATQAVRGTNRCQIALYADRLPGHAILVSVIDNLVKGAAGQAIQNMNVRFGFPETTALEMTAVFP